MGVKLTFNKSFELAGAAGTNNASLDVITTDGEQVDDVVSVSVEQNVGGFPMMTLKVLVRETFAQNAAVRLKK